ncbi:MAG TPA: helix-turn-helix domain-containing protein [Mycobacterium sp.]|jgi:AcrR family transcriptional regulator|nr:helix-turn-helix domain-containing protein [Mycobacterium sp.]
MRRRVDPEIRRQEILAAARRVFATRPYEQVSLEEIAREAGASRPLVSHYFGDKRGVFLAVARETVARAPHTVRTDLGLSVEAMVDANTTAWLDAVAANPESSLLLLGSGPPGRDPELEALLDELRDRLAERILINHLGTTEIPPAALMTMRAATGLMEVTVRDWLLGKGPTRQQTHTIIAQGILAIVRHVLPTVLALDRTSTTPDRAQERARPTPRHRRTRGVPTR